MSINSSHGELIVAAAVLARFDLDQGQVQAIAPVINGITKPRATDKMKLNLSTSGDLSEKGTAYLRLPKREES